MIQTKLLNSSTVTPSSPMIHSPHLELKPQIQTYSVTVMDSEMIPKKSAVVLAVNVLKISRNNSDQTLSLIVKVKKGCIPRMHECSQLTLRWCNLKGRTLVMPMEALTLHSKLFTNLLSGLGVESVQRNVRFNNNLALTSFKTLLKKKCSVEMKVRAVVVRWFRI